MAENPIEALKQFLKDHPEIMPAIAEIAAEAAAGPATPLTLYGVMHELVDGIRLGIDDERRAQMHAAIDEHQAQHEQMAGGGGSPAAEAPAPEPVPVPAPSASPAGSLPLDDDPGV